MVVAAALAACLAGIAFAQDNTATSSIGDEGPAAFLKRENIQDFYTDPNMKTMKSADEVKRIYQSMTADDQARMKAACAANDESRFADLCENIGSI